MAKDKVELEKVPEVVLKQMASGQKGKAPPTYSFTVTEEQRAFLKAHSKEINFSETFRRYLDRIIASHGQK